MIKFSKNNIQNKDIKVVEKILKSGWLTHGNYSKQFEQKFISFTKSKYSTLVSSCTAGLHLSCLALDIGKGDEVIVPSQTHVATAHAVSYCGAKPVFADINLYNGDIDSSSIIKKITKKTKAIIVVHLNGFSCDMKKITFICKKYKIKLIEDCAHALGTLYKKKHAGNFGSTGVFSFYPTKQITTGEGGIVVTNDKKIFKKIKALKAFGIDKDINERKRPGVYEVNYLGYNYRMTDFQAAIGLQQLNRYSQELKIRKKNAKYLCKNLKNLKSISVPKYDNNHSYFIFPIFVKKNRYDLMDLFKTKNIQFSIHYATPVEKFSYYSRNQKKISKLINSNIYSEENISLPIHSGINYKSLNYIIKTIKFFDKKL